MERISTVAAFTLASATLVAWMETATPSRGASDTAAAEHDRPSDLACGQSSAPEGCVTTEDTREGVDLAPAAVAAPELDSDRDGGPRAGPAPVYEPERTYFPAQTDPPPGPQPDQWAGQDSAPRWHGPAAPAGGYEDLEAGPPPPPYGYQGNDVGGVWGGATGQAGDGAGAYDLWGYARPGGFAHRVPERATARWDQYPGAYGGRGGGHGGGYAVPGYGRPSYGYWGQGPAYRDSRMGGGGYTGGPYGGPGGAYDAYGPDIPPPPPSMVPRYGPRGAGAMYPAGAGTARGRVWTSVLMPLDLAAEVEIRNGDSPVAAGAALTVGGYDIRPFLGSWASDKPRESHGTDTASLAAPSAFGNRPAGEAGPEVPWPTAAGKEEPGEGSLPVQGTAEWATEGPEVLMDRPVSQTPGLAAPPRDAAPVPGDSADTGEP